MQPLDDRLALTRVFDDHSLPLCVFDRTGRYLYLNRAAERTLAREREDCLGTRYLDHATAREGDPFDVAFKAVVADDEPRAVTVRADGRSYEVELSTLPDAVFVFWREVTEAMRLQALYDFTVALSRTISPSEVAEAAVEQATAQLGTRSAALWAVGDRALELLAQRHYPEPLARELAVVPLETDWPIAEAARTARTVWVSTKAEYAERYPAVHARLAPIAPPGEAAFVCVPVIAHGRCVGVMALHFNGARPLTHADRGFVETIAEQTGQALDRARLLDAERRSRLDAEVAQQRFRAVFDHAIDAIVITDAEARIVEANRAAGGLLGTTSAALVGRHASELVRPSDATLSQARSVSLRQQGAQRGEIDLVRADGTVVRVEYSAVANVVPGINMSVLRDVDARTRTDQALRLLADASVTLGSSLEYDATLAAVARLVVPQLADWAAVDMLADDGVSFRRLAVEHVDPKKIAIAHELWNLRPARLDDALGVGAVVRSGQPLLVELITDEMLVAGLEDPDELRMFRALGLVSSMCVPLRVRGRAIGAITLVTAESRRRFGPSDLAFAEELARRAGLAIENALSLREAQEANRLKDEFLATISHELRTPLHAILGWATLLRSKRGVDVDKAVTVIERNARAQARLIDDVLDVSRIITGKLKLEPRKIDVAKVLRAAVEVVAPMAAAKGVALVTEIEVEPCPVVGDADRLQQVCWNLLSNAVKFTPADGRIVARVRRSDSDVELSVTDSGRGISPEFLPRLFERFRQADSSITRREGGLGLGLAIVRHLVELHGGTVAAHSDGIGRGATFTVTLPTRAVLRSRAGGNTTTSSTELPEQSEQRASVGWRLAGLKVLVCDDDADARELIAEVLGSEGAAVTTATGAEEALAHLAEGPLDALVSDIGMPVIDGYRLIELVRARADAQGGRVPALALTAFARAEDAERALRAGYQRHVAKPVDSEELIAALSALVGRSRA